MFRYRGGKTLAKKVSGHTGPRLCPPRKRVKKKGISQLIVEEETDWMPDHLGEGPARFSARIPNQGLLVRHVAIFDNSGSFQLSRFNKLDSVHGQETLSAAILLVFGSQEEMGNVKEILSNDIIEDSFLLYSSPIVMVPLTFNFQYFNRITNDFVHLLLVIHKVLKDFRQADIFSKLDFHSKYWQILLMVLVLKCLTM
jgi:hypothetical protein